MRVTVNDILCHTLEREVVKEKGGVGEGGHFSHPSGFHLFICKFVMCLLIMMLRKKIKEPRTRHMAGLK